MKSKGSLWFRAGFLAPAVIFYFVLVLWPLVQAFQLSFFRLTGLSTKKTFVGWENFQTVFSDGVFVRALGHNLILLVSVVAIVLLVGFPLAMAAQGQGRLAKTLRAFYLVPHVISLVVVAIMWQAIFLPDGLVTAGLKAIGFTFAPKEGWMGDPRTSLGTIIVAFSWYALGFGILVLQAGIKGIPTDVNEAAELDGAHGARRFWSIIWPLSWPTRRIVVIQTCIGALNTFALVRLMTNSGPDRASEVVLTYLYERGFQNSRLGEGTAIAILNFFVVLIITAVVLIVFGRNPVEAKR